MLAAAGLFQAEESDAQSAGTGVGAYDAAYGHDGQVVGVADPEAGAVLLVFEQRGVREAGVAEGVGHGEIHAVLLYHLREQVAAFWSRVPCR